MELPYSTPQGVAGTYCVPWNPSDPLMSAYEQAANMFNTDNDPSLAAIIKVALQNQIMLYRKANCTDCATQGLPATQTVINPPTVSGSVTPVGVVQTNTTDQTEAMVAATAAKVTSGIPVVGEIASIISDIVGIFGQAHAQAVAEEQATNCAVAYAFNKWIPQYDAAVASGQMSAQDALAAVIQLIQQQLSPALDPVINGHNWGWGANQVLQAHLWFRQQWYPQLETAASTLTAKASGLVSEADSILSGNPIILVAVVALVVLLISGRKGVLA